VALDERLRRELERAGRPADPSGIYEDLIRRRERRRITRKVESGVLAIAVVTVSVAGVYWLSRVFTDDDRGRSATPGALNGLIVVSREIPGEGEHLFVVAPDGSGARRLTPDGRAVYRSPDVSPDGRTIVVAHEIPSFEPGLSVLALLSIDGGSPEWLTEPHVFRDPAWSPDGSKIAFAGSLRGPFGIYVFDVHTGKASLVPGTEETSVGHPTWSPDGKRIAFEGSTDSDTDPNQNWDLYSVRLNGSDLTNLTNTRDESETMPAWSWTMNRIAFVAARTAEGVLASIAPDGTDPQRVWDGENIPNDPIWSPDGERVAFWVDTGQVDMGQVYTVRVNGSDLQPVASAMGPLAWAIVADGAPVMPTPTPTMSASPVGKGIGLGFTVCNVTSVRGQFTPGVDGKAFVATRAGDTACPDPGDGMQVLAVDITGDGLADTSYGPLQCDQWCSAYSAPDVDGDGTDEVLVQNVEFSIVGLKLYEVQVGDGGAALGPVTVARPGSPLEGFEPGAEPQLWLGGDAFELDTLRCEDSPDGHVLVYTTATQDPPDTFDSVWRATATTFSLNDDFTVSIVDVREFTEPFGADAPSFQSGETLCGSNLGPSQA
jgi:Tol biopolymer transport system component